ncbi:MAG: hypothetical protein ABH837_02145 [bacterium]
MKSKNRILNYLIEEVTNQFLDGIDFAEDVITYPYKKCSKKKRFKFESDHRRSLKNLINQQLIVQREDKFYLTLKGKLELLRCSNNKIKVKKSKWDRKWRIIAFDIPESKRKTRRHLREYLFQLDFRAIQQSIWITPYKIKFEDLTGLFDKTVTEKLVFIETHKISNEEKIKKLFSLSSKKT